MSNAMNLEAAPQDATLAFAPFANKVVQFYESLTPQSVADLRDVYEARARFKDPFNDVQGLPAIQAIFAHMFETLENPRFVVTTRLVQGKQCFLAWEFRFRFKRFHAGQDQCIVGASYLEFAPDGRIRTHRDYWDAAEELYEKLPWIGRFMRWLKKRASS